MKELIKQALDEAMVKVNNSIPQSKKVTKADRFNSISFKCVYDVLLSNGYERDPYSIGLIKDFIDTTIYDMYMNEDFDRLVEYYSNPFKLKGEQK